MAPGRGERGGTAVVHSSDVHVDDGYTARLNGGDGTAGLRRVLGAARRLGAGLTLLAGDVFEHNRLPEAVLASAREALEEAGMPVVILPGNHDPLTPGSAWERGRIDEPANVRVIGMDGGDSAAIPELDLEIWGRAHRDYGDMAPLAAPPPRAARWRVVMAHGHYCGPGADGAAHRPSWLISDSEIAATGADYVALGHWNRAVRVGGGAVPAWYSGSPDFAGTVNLVRLGADGSVSVAREPLTPE